MVEIKFLGGANEVGRAAYLIDSGIDKTLLEYGINVQEFLTPQPPPIAVDSVFISHSHLDHIGMLPEIYKRGYKKETHLTQTTHDLAHLLLYDAIKVQESQGKPPFFGSGDIEKFSKNSVVSGFKERIEFGSSVAEFRDAGHIPGSSSILLETGGKRILYTGDIKFSDTVLMQKADTSFKDIDVLITESTYPNKNHPDRKALADQLREKIQEVVYNDGTALIPAFAVGRFQEILMLVYDLGFPVYMDGMGVKATELILSNPGSVKNPEMLRKAFGRSSPVKGNLERRDILKDPSIIVTTSGMLTGGPVHTYIKSLYNREDCAIILTGFQVEGTPGRHLMDTGKFLLNGLELETKMQVHHMDFSAHAGKDELYDFFEKVNPKKIIPVHGDSIEGFVSELKGKGFDSILAKNGDTIKV